MNYLTEYWAAIVVVAILLGLIGYLAYLIYTKQTSKIQKWLLFAVTLAEKELQSKTGKLKLEYVYDLFKTRFPYIHFIMPRETFEELVKAALHEMRKQMEQNVSFAEYVKKESIGGSENV